MMTKFKARTLTITAIMWLIVTVFCMACSSESPLLKENKRNEELWLRQNIADYRYTLDWRLNVTNPPDDDPRKEPVTIEVREGSAFSLTYAGSGTQVSDRSGIFSEVDDIGKLFFYIRQISRQSDSITVQYDETLGYPTDIRQWPSGEGPDSWIIWLRVFDFEVIDHEEP